MTANPKPTPAARLRSAWASRRPSMISPLTCKLKTILCLSAGMIYALRVRVGSTEEFFFWRQDLPVLVLCVAITVGLGFLRPIGALRLPAWPMRTWVWGLAGACLVIGAVGTPLVFQGYKLSLDEFMAEFDAQIFAHGQGRWRPPPRAWRGYVPAGAAADVHLAGARRRAVGLGLSAGECGDAQPGSRTRPRRGPAQSAALSAVSVIALYGVARRLWPERPRMALGAAALLATSSQLLVMSMTAYAMSAHLAFNLVWLWLFLRGGRLGHAGAIVVAFLACGLHQLVFHPLFAAPFVLQLWLERRWRLAGLYTLAYAAIGLFWIFYWSLALKLVGAPPQAASALGGGWFAHRLADIFASVRFQNLGAMAESLVRFITWQNPLTAPLALAGGLAAERAKGHLRALAFGVVLTLIAMLLLVPSQTHGWGYRYLHGLLGSVCLIAVWSWTRLTDGLAPAARARANGAFVAACLISILGLFPLRAWQAWSYVRPYAAANALIQSSKAQVVLIDHEDEPWFDMGTLTRNDPYLVSGPKVMALSYLDAAQVRQLCAHFSVVTFDGVSAQNAGVDVISLSPDPKVVRLRALMRQLTCGPRIG